MSPLARLLRMAMTAVLAFNVSWPSQAQTYPDKSRTFKIIVPGGAASIVDILSRALGQAMSDAAGLNVVVDNKPGAESVIGIRAFMASAPDGYTLLNTSNSSQTLNPLLIANLPYNPLTDFTPLVGIGKFGLVLNLGTSTTFKTAAEFIAAARAAPGQYSCASASSVTRLGCLLLQSTAGIKLLNVPYKANAAAAVALGSGEVDALIVDAGSVRTHWQSGRVRGVAVTSSARMRMLPNLPTLKEEGVKDYEVMGWIACYLPVGTPADAVTGMREILGNIVKSKTFVDMLATNYIEPLELTGDALIEMNRREIENWRNTFRSLNIAPAK